MSENTNLDNTQKLSAEEFLEMYKSGQGAISQIKEDEDGTKHFFNVYGDVHDGIDHFLNVFVNSECFSNVFAALANGKLKKPDNLKEKDSQYDGYQITIDYTNEPIMWLVEKTKDSFRLRAYQRDEKKGFYSAAIDKEWPIEGDDFEITTEKIQEDNYLYYLALFVGLRNHLMSEGIIDKLREMQKYSAAGVVITADDEDSVTARIVEGRGRPDLPCEMFLMGTITCRPYLDETLSEALLSRMDFDELIKAAEKGNAEAMEFLAMAYLNGEGVSQDFEKAFYWHEKLAEAGSSMGQFNTGLYYAKGCGTARDFKKASEWMRKAAENGDQDAISHIDLYEKAHENLQKALTGDAEAQADIAKLFTVLGNSLDQFDTSDADYKEAFKWSQKAADQGNLEGIYNLALCYEHGRGTGVDIEKAAELYKKAADRDHAPSQWNLACFYLNGVYGAAEHRGPFTIWNETEGLMLAYKSADQGYELAINGLERSGNSVEQIIEYYANEDVSFMLEGTQYQGRADRCERIHSGDELTYKFAKDDHGLDCLEFFFKGESVGMMYQYRAAKLMALLRLNRVDLKTTVRSIIPKSKRGPRARNAEVSLNLVLTEAKPETEEEKKARLAAEEARRKEEEERQRKEAEEREKQEQERQRQERLRQEREEREKRDRQRELNERRKAVAGIRNMLFVDPESGASAVITLDGKVHTSGLPDPLRQAVESWTDMKQVWFRVRPDSWGNADHRWDNIFAAGVKQDGTVVFTGQMCDQRIDVSQWRNIEQISCGWQEILGLTRQGTVLATGDSEHGALDVGGWRDVKQVIGGVRHSIGLKGNGTVLECGDDNYMFGLKDRPQNDYYEIAVDGPRSLNIYGLKKDGKVHCPFSDIYDIPKWENIASIADGIDDEIYIFGLTDKGEVKISFHHESKPKYSQALRWKNVVCIAGGKDSIVAITEDGRVIGNSGANLTAEMANLKLFDNYKTAGEERERMIQEALRKKQEAIRKQAEAVKSRITSLQTEMDNVSGLLAGMKKKKIQAEIDQLKRQLDNLKA